MLIKLYRRNCHPDTGHSPQSLIKIILKYRFDLEKNLSREVRIRTKPEESYF